MGEAEPMIFDHEKLTTRFLFAATQGIWEDVRFLLGEPCRVDPDKTRDPLNGRTALHYAAEQGREEVVRGLIQMKADVRIRDNYADQPLHDAAFRGRPNIVELLLDAGADPNDLNGDGESALTSVATGYKLVFEEILPKFERRSAEGGPEPPGGGAFRKSAELLLKAKADPLLTAQRFGDSPLSIAAGIEKGLGAELQHQLNREGGDARHSVAEALIEEVVGEISVCILPEVCTLLSESNIVSYGEIGRTNRTAGYTEDSMAPVSLLETKEQPYYSYEKKLLIHKKVHKYHVAGVPQVSTLQTQLARHPLVMAGLADAAPLGEGVADAAGVASLG